MMRYGFSMMSFQENDSTYAFPHDCYLGISENNAYGVHEFPNPASNDFQIELKQGVAPKTMFEAYDALGRLVKQEILNKSITTIDRSDLNNGIYFWQVVDGEKILDRDKLVLQ